MTALVVYLSGVVFFAFQSAMCAPRRRLFSGSRPWPSPTPRAGRGRAFTPRWLHGGGGGAGRERVEFDQQKGGIQ